ncbi:MAG: FAD:protein FMN transferase [Chitinispirillaceae bacterium]|nr:FAD:protein FMN transferase [Chitinispirillaceae bacterium]
MSIKENRPDQSRRSVTAAFRQFGAMAVALIVVFGCGGKHRKHKRTFFRMDTVTDITVVLPEGDDLKPIWRSVDSLLLDWEERFSVTGEKSEVQALNRRTQQAMPVGRQLAAIIAFALRCGDTLDGGFDLTILPVKEVWGFGEQASESMPLPVDAQVDSALVCVNYKNIRLNDADDSVFFASPATRIDIGGIAKGFVLHEVARVLDARNIADYLVVAGGDVVGKGRRPDGKPWLVGIQHPRSTDSLLGTLSLDNASVVTSGDYERFRIVDGKRYHHIFNSHTGRSCLANQSVTVSGENPVEVDVLSTGLFCRSAGEIVAYINKRPGFQCLVVDSTGKIFKSSGWKGEVGKGRK